MAPSSDREINSAAGLKPACLNMSCLFLFFLFWVPVPASGPGTGVSAFLATVSGVSVTHLNAIGAGRFIYNIYVKYCRHNYPFLFLVIYFFTTARNLALRA